MAAAEPSRAAGRQGPTQRPGAGRVPGPPGGIGIATVGPPGATTWLRLSRTAAGGDQLFRAWTSRDGVTWVPGSTWRTDDLAGARIGLVAGGVAGSTATFDHVRVWSPAR